MRNIDFSIIIPIFNASQFLKESLESVLNQTHQNIEIICIDDASSDKSKEILEKYASRDQRIHIIAKNSNEGTSKARKDGVLCSRGKHILFVDADDKLVKYACERLLEIYEVKAADIIQFDAYVKISGNVEESKVNEIQHYLKPCDREINIKDVQELCFSKGVLSHSLWGKMFDGAICRKAFEYLSDDKLIMAEDLYAYFAISLFSKTYIGVREKLYQYNYGTGITGGGMNFLESIEINCKQLAIVSKCYEFIKKIGEEEKYIYLAEGIRKYLINTFAVFLIDNKKMCEEDIDLIQEILSLNCDSKDLGYMSALLGMQCQHYKQAIEDRGWVFPYQNIKKGSRVIIYGAGAVGKDYYEQLKVTEYCEIVAWVDKAYEKLGNSVNNILSPEIIKSMNYDYIILAIKDEAIRKTVKEYLLGIRVNEDDIV